MQILTDHGGQFYIPIYKSDFDIFCIQNDILHVRGAINKPRTLCKIERCHHAYDVERHGFRKHEQFSKYYNKRVHMSMNYMTPRQVYKDRRIVIHLVR